MSDKKITWEAITEKKQNGENKKEFQELQLHKDEQLRVAADSTQ